MRQLDHNGIEGVAGIRHARSDTRDIPQEIDKRLTIGPPRVPFVSFSICIRFDITETFYRISDCQK